MESTIDNKIPQGLPSEVRAWLSQASQTLIESLGEELEALVLFGSAAEGLMRASSDVNLLVVLNRFDPERIDRASAILQDAAAAVELHPMFLLASELPLAGESFSVKFDDIAHRHIVLYGKDPFEGLSNGHVLHAAGTIRTFLLRSYNGKEAGSASVVKGRCEILEGSGESETFGAAGGEEAAADARGSRAESDGVGCQF